MLEVGDGWSSRLRTIDVAMKSRLETIHRSTVNSLRFTPSGTFHGLLSFFHPVKSWVKARTSLVTWPPPAMNTASTLQKDSANVGWLPSGYQ
jgi:hypothetical protein